MADISAVTSILKVDKLSVSPALKFM